MGRCWKSCSSTVVWTKLPSPNPSCQGSLWRTRAEAPAQAATLSDSRAGKGVQNTPHSPASATGHPKTEIEIAVNGSNHSGPCVGGEGEEAPAAGASEGSAAPKPGLSPCVPPGAQPGPGGGCAAAPAAGPLLGGTLGTSHPCPCPCPGAAGMRLERAGALPACLFQMVAVPGEQ